MDFSLSSLMPRLALSESFQDHLVVESPRFRDAASSSSQPHATSAEPRFLSRLAKPSHQAAELRRASHCFESPPSNSLTAASFYLYSISIHKLPRRSCLRVALPPPRSFRTPVLSLRRAALLGASTNWLAAADSSNLCLSRAGHQVAFTQAARAFAPELAAPAANHRPAPLSEPPPPPVRPQVASSHQPIAADCASSRPML